MTLHMHSDVTEGQAQTAPLYRNSSQAKWCYTETGPTNNHSCIIIYLCNVLNIFPALVEQSQSSQFPLYCVTHDTHEQTDVEGNLINSP